MQIQYFLSFIKNSKLLIFLLLGGVVGILIIPWFISKEPDSVQPSPVASPTIIYPFGEQPIFPISVNSATTTLSIGTDPSGAEVTIDQEILNRQNIVTPINISPFTLKNIPVGKHTLRIFKLGYLVKNQEIEVLENKSNDFSIKLEKNPEENQILSIISELPVSTEDYYIEYLDAIKKIQVVIRQAPYESNKVKAIDWFKRNGINNPEAAGIEFYPALNIQ